jgi:hypothetical protein
MFAGSRAPETATALLDVPQIAKQKICCTAFRFDLFLLQRALFCCGASYIVKVAPRRVMHLFVMGKLEMPKPREYAFRRKS